MSKPQWIKETVDFRGVIAYSVTRPVPTLQQLDRMAERGVTPHIIERADGTRLYLGATNAVGDNVDNDCRLLR